MKKTILTLLCGCALALALLPSQAEALKVKFEPSVTFRNSYNSGYYNPGRVVRQHYDEVHVYHDPYTHSDHYYYYPMTQEYIEYYPSHRSGFFSSGTDFNLKFKFR
jgi:hypothetical protein